MRSRPEVDAGVCPAPTFSRGAENFAPPGPAARRSSGTPAAAMPQLPRAVREARAHEAAAVAAEMRDAFLRSQTGRLDDVLFEAGVPGVQQGHTRNYLPISVAYPEDLKGQIRRVRITAADGDHLTGELADM